MVAKTKMSKSSNWCGVLLTIVLVTLLSTIHVQAVVEVELTAYAPVTDNTVTLCPDQDFVLVFECLVRDASLITWKLPPLIINSDGSFDFNVQDQLSMSNDTITFIFINQTTTPTEKISLLQVPTGDIIREIGIDAGDHLTVSCSAFSLTTITKTMTIRISDGIPELNSCRQSISSQPIIAAGCSTTSSLMEMTCNTTTVLLTSTTFQGTPNPTVTSSPSPDNKAQNEGTPTLTVTSSLSSSPPSSPSSSPTSSPSPDNKAQNEVAIVTVIVIAVLLSIYNSY